MTSESNKRRSFENSGSLDIQRIEDLRRIESEEQNVKLRRLSWAGLGISDQNHGSIR